MCLSYLLTRHTYAESEVDCIIEMVCVCVCVFIWISLNILFTLVENCNELMMYRFAVKQPTYQDTIHLGMFFLCILIFLSLFRPNVGVPSETFRFHRSKMIHTLLYHRFKVNAQILDVKISVYIHIYSLYIYVWKSYSLFGSCILLWMHLTREKWSFFFSLLVLLLFCLFVPYFHLLWTEIATFLVYPHLLSHSIHRHCCRCRLHSYVSVCKWVFETREIFVFP